MKTVKTMKVFAIIMLVALSLCLHAYVMAAEILINAPITDRVDKISKRGSPYVRLIVEETKSVGGVEYKTGTPAMAFGDKVADVSGLKVGDNLKAVVATREYQGRTSYTILKVVK